MTKPSTTNLAGKMQRRLLELESLLQAGLYASTIWYARLLLDVLLHFVIMDNAEGQEDLEQKLVKFNSVERLDMKLDVALKISCKEMISDEALESLSKLIYAARNLERGTLAIECWPNEARQSAQIITELSKKFLS